MKKFTEGEWAILEALWQGKHCALGDVVEAIQPAMGWSRNTVFTYLTRMEKKGLVSIDRSQERPYTAAISREDCARTEREALLTKVYGGATGDLVAAFLKESVISTQERDRLRRLLDEMEV